MPIPTSPPNSQSRLRVTVVGCGTLGRGIVTGILKDRPKDLDLKDVVVTARRQNHGQELKDAFPELAVTLNNRDPQIWSNGRSTSDGIHLLIIATKPRDIRDVCGELYRTIEQNSTRPVVITLCPGITVEQIKGWLPKDVPVIRSMPNTPVMVCQGATGLFPCPLVSQIQLQFVTRIFKIISPSVVVLPRENLLDVVASVAGSAPAYFYHLMGTMVNAAKELGLDEASARDLITQSCAGSGFLARDVRDVSLLQLKDDVCVPGGSTRKAMNVLDAHGWHKYVGEAINESLIANRAMSTNKIQKA